MAAEAGREVVSLGIDYGQRHHVELEYARAQCRARGIERRVLRVEWDKPADEVPVGRTMEEMRSGIAPTFLPGRNAVFLTLACAEAAGIGAGEVWIGVNAVDFSGYPDCRPAFIEAFTAMMALAIPDGPAIIAPVIHRSKAEIAAEGRRLGLAPGDTWSCYQPRMTARGLSPCGACDACVLHDHAWRHADDEGPPK